MKTFADILSAARDKGPRGLAVAGAPNVELEEAIQRAEQEGLASPQVFDSADSAAIAVRDGECDVLMKGSVSTKAFMQAVLKKEHKLRSGHLISHVFVTELRGRLIIITDAGVCIAPTLEEKVEIIRNAIPLANRLGIELPKVAVLAAVEKVDPKMPVTVEADALSKMAIPGCVVQGPLALDLAVSPAAAETKGVSGPAAGRADILVVPDVAAGNIFAKSIMYFSNCPTGGLVVGTNKAVTFSSRSDSADTKFHTLALGVLMS